MTPDETREVEQKRQARDEAVAATLREVRSLTANLRTETAKLDDLVARLQEEHDLG